uniref:Nucleolar protein 12 n=1 Tax=Lygus hesperus TaxID=30085 RepID=A0A0A9Y0C6_LYGHE
MVRYVDTGLDDDVSNSVGRSVGNSKKKKVKRGFKIDRRANFERMMSRKAGTSNVVTSSSKKQQLTGGRTKAITFDESDRRDYLLTLHKKKNERRVQAFVDAKRKLRKESAKTRREQREEARRAYNNYARVPILPNYTYQLPNYLNNESDDAVD